MSLWSSKSYVIKENIKLRNLCNECPRTFGKHPVSPHLRLFALRLTCARGAESGRNSTDNDMTDCSADLASYINQNPKAFAGISSLISCVLNARRALSIHELESAFQMCGRVEPSSYSAAKIHELFISLVVQADSVFMISPSGTISFRDRHMYTFLQKFQVDGLDTSHRLIAWICKSALLRFSSDNRDSERHNDMPGRSFLAYAQRYYHLHLSRAAEYLAKRMTKMNLSSPDEDWVILDRHDQEGDSL